MRESETYMGILEEGAVDHTKELILRLGRKAFGEPSDTIATRLSALEDLDRLDRIIERIPEVRTWEELLGTE